MEARPRLTHSFRCGRRGHGAEPVIGPRFAADPLAALPTLRVLIFERTLQMLERHKERLSPKDQMTPTGQRQ